AVFEHPAVDVGVGFGADVAPGEQVLQRPAGAVGEFGDVAVEPGPPLDGWAGGLVDLRQGGEVDVGVGGHDAAPASVVIGSVNVKRGTASGSETGPVVMAWLSMSDMAGRRPG